MSTIQNLFEQAQLAEAAYADFAAHPNDPIAALKAEGMSTAQATALANEWSVVDQLPNQANGFSATLFEKLDANKVGTGQYSFAIRGSLDRADFIADASLIITDGVAVSQLVEMYNYWQRLTHLGVYQAATLTTQVTETAYLTALLASNLVLYESARVNLLSQGYIVEGGTVYQAGFDLSTNVFTDSRQWGSNTLAGQTVSVDGHSLGGHLAMAFSRLFPNATADVTAVNGLGFKVADANVNNLFTQLGGQPGFNTGAIQNVYGIAGSEFAAMNNGVLQQPGAWDGIYIEDGSLFTAQIGGYSAAQMTDSLAVYNLLAKLDPTLNSDPNGLSTITDILKAESSVAANSLESAIAALGKLFGVANTAFTGSEFDADRNKLYTALNDIQSQVKNFYTINWLGKLDATTLTANAKADPSTNPEQGIAYRYALVNGNPFAVLGADYSTFNQNGELDLYDPATGHGQLTEQYLADRSAYLVVKLRDNTVDSTSSTLKDVRYQDFESSTHLNPINTELRKVTFGSAADEGFSGAGGNDSLYGSAGNDTLWWREAANDVRHQDEKRAA